MLDINRTHVREVEHSADKSFHINTDESGNQKKPRDQAMDSKTGNKRPLIAPAIKHDTDSHRCKNLGELEQEK